MTARKLILLLWFPAKHALVSKIAYLCALLAHNTEFRALSNNTRKRGKATIKTSNSFIILFSGVGGGLGDSKRRRDFVDGFFLDRNSLAMRDFENFGDEEA